MDAHTITLVLEIVTPVVFALGFLNAGHAIMKVRSPRGVVAWALALLLIPYVAIPLYWIFGRYRFNGYVRYRRSGDRQVDRVARDFMAPLEPFRGRPPEAYGAPVNLGERLAGLPYTRGNLVDLLVDGKSTFETMFAEIDKAQSYILVQFFIVHADQIGQAFKQRLIEKARQGVRVYFIYDHVGSKNLPRRYARELRKGGVQVHAFYSSLGWSSRFQFNLRNHRKLVVVDGKVAFVGGLNLGDEYLGHDRRFKGWRDTNVRIRGPAVKAVQVPFIEDWHWLTRSIPDLNWEPEPEAGGLDTVLVLPTGPADEFDTCHFFFLRSIDCARERLWIASPYFVPDHAVVAALQMAALRGVDVRIMLPEKPDHLLVYLSSFSYIDDMHSAGVKMFRYQPGFMHQKVMLIDDQIAVVGTANLDNRSFYLNFELMVAVSNPYFTREVETMLLRDFESCRPIAADEYKKKSFIKKIAIRSARIISPIQ